MLVLEYFFLIQLLNAVLMLGNVVSAEDRHKVCYNAADMKDDECGSIQILSRYCASYNETTGTVSTGDCPYHFRFNSWIHYESPDLVTISVNSCSLLNNVTCGQLNREGLLCSKCMAGHGRALLSTNWICAECRDKNSYLMWILYLVLVLVPPTIFFFIVVIFNVRVTSLPFTAYVFYCQYFTELFKASPYFSTSVVNYINPYVYKLVFTVIDIWSLDFFRHLIPPFCVNSSLTISHYIFFDLIPIAYLLFLVVLTYVLIELHARNTYVIVLLWKPFNKCVSKVRRSLDPKVSIFNAFSTFTLLSLSKILFLTSIFLYGFDQLCSSYYYDPTKPSLIHIQPYKESCMNTTEGILYSIVAALSVLISSVYPEGYIKHYIGYYIIMFLVLLPSIILLFLFFRKLILKTFLYDYMKRGTSKCLFCCKSSDTQSIEDKLPHRMISPSEYSPLL